MQQIATKIGQIIIDPKVKPILGSKMFLYINCSKLVVSFHFLCNAMLHNIIQKTIDTMIKISKIKNCAQNFAKNNWKRLGNLVKIYVLSLKLKVKEVIIVKIIAIGIKFNTLKKGTQSDDNRF
jgi:hypothetical protein